MNLNHLRWALEVERLGSFSAAASRLFVAQSNLSNGIKALEDEVGFRIFVRRSRGAEATPLGRDFLASARQAVYRLQSLEATYEKRIFSVAVHRHCTFVADALAEFAARHQGERLRIVIRECAEEHILESIYSGESMFGVNFYPAESETALDNALQDRNLTQEVFLECGMNLLVRRGHPLTHMSSITLESLYAYPIAAFAENETKAISFASQAKAVGMELDRFDMQLTLGDRATLYRLLSQSDSVFLTGKMNRLEQESYGLASLPVPEFTRKYSVITPKGVEQPTVCLELIEQIKSAAIRLL